MTKHDGRTMGRTGGTASALGLVTALFMVAAGCGDDTTATGGGGNGGEPVVGGGGAAQGGSAQGGAGGAGGGTGGGGAEAYACSDALDVESRGSAIALSDDDAVLAVTNRDVGSVSVFAVTYPGAGDPAVEKTAEVATGAGSEPWSVVIDGCNSRAWVALRNEDKVVVIDNLTNGPEIIAEIDVGAEPTGLALSPDNTRLYVANWVEGTVSVIDTADNTVADTVDLNATLAATGYLGDVQPRPALAHPRAIAADATRVVVSEWYGQRTIPDGANGVDADISKSGILYSIAADTLVATAIDLPPVTDTGFRDHLNGTTGCFVNQVNSVTLKDNFAYVTSTCASPEGPLGVFQRGACTATANCSAFGGASVCSSGACTLACTADADCGFGSPAGTCNTGNGTCAPIATNVKTTTHPALSLVDLSDDSASTVALDALFDAPAIDSARMPHLPTDLAFFGDFAYVSAMGTDAVFRLEIAGDTVVSVGSATNDFINLRVDASDTTIKNPIGIATIDGADGFAFVANDGSQEVTALSLAAQAIVGAPVASATLPTGEGLRRLKGKRFFNTGLGRWSLGGEGWGSCAACHIDGLTDNVTWYFARGPRQSTSLDGSFASDDPTDRRAYNWSAIFDETADFELNTRGVSGGVGAIVSSSAAPISNGQRINIAAETPPQQGLSGSTADVANPASPNGEAPFGTSAHPHSVLDDWEEIDLYLQSVRSPRRPVGLVAADVAAGETIFASTSQGNCVACHSGAKWTISSVFWTVGDTGNADLLNAEWLTETTAATFPAALLPVAAPDASNARMRFGNAANDQILCLIRNVGTFPAAGTVGVGPAAVGIAELRQDMVTLGQGGAATSRGFNVPSLLGVQTGAPFFHGGNARTLEEVFDETFFAGHHRSAVAQVFDPTDDQKRQLVAYLLSLDEAEPTIAIPALSSLGGDFCAPN
jgi:YVTN family beta-propeller protein